MFEPVAGTPRPAFAFSPAVPPPLPSSAMYELRPLSTGEILDRTFALYRRRFWLYAGLSAIAATVSVLAQLAQFLWTSHLPAAQQAAHKVAGATPSAGFDFKTMALGLVAAYTIVLLHFLVYSITQAATVSAVSSIYLGHETDLRTALRATIGKWWKWAAIAFWQVWSALWIPFLLIIPAAMLVAMKVPGLVAVGGFLFFLAFLSLIYGVIAYLRNSLAIPASVFEHLPIRTSMRRSKILTVDLKGRLFLLCILLYILAFVAGMLQVPFALLMLPTGHFGHRILVQGGSLIMLFLSNTLVGPVGAIAFCLFYFDSRVRKEGFDIEALMDPTLGSPLAPPAVLLPTGFAPSGFTAEPPPSPFAPSPFTVAAPPPASPFAPSEFTASPSASGEPN